MNFNAIVCNAFGVDISEINENQLSCVLQRDDGAEFIVHACVNAMEEVMTLTGLLDARIPDQITQEIFMTLCHAGANPLVADFGVGIVPDADYFVVFKIIPLSLVTEEYLKFMFSKLMTKITYWNELLDDCV